MFSRLENAGGVIERAVCVSPQDRKCRDRDDGYQSDDERIFDESLAGIVGKELGKRFHVGQLSLIYGELVLRNGKISSPSGLGSMRFRYVKRLSEARLEAHALRGVMICKRVGVP